MPRRNFSILFMAIILCVFCYHKADSAKRNEHRRIFNIIHKAMSIIETKHVKEVPPRQLLEGSLKGMTDTLDEYSAYIGPDHYRQFRETLDQAFGGIGIQVSLDEETKQLVVTSPLVGTPAYNAGVMAGDKLLAIEGKSTEGFELEDAVKLLRGKAGEAVKITVQHLGSEESKELNIVREIIQVDTVLGDTYNADGTWDYFLAGHDKIGLIRITQFGDRTVAEMTSAMKKLSAGGMKGLILDLRNNPGGLLEAAVGVCDLFIKDGRIVSTQGRNAEPQMVWDASGTASYTNFPMVVLVNHFSASASEIVSAALQDHQRALVVGERSWGKGSVQNLIELEPGKTALKLTTASYWRPSGHNIHRFKDSKPEDEWGITPDEGYEVTMTREEMREVLLARRNRDVVRPSTSFPVPPPANPDDPEAKPPAVDRQLEKAIEYLQNTLSNPTTSTPPAAKAA